MTRLFTPLFPARQEPRSAQPAGESRRSSSAAQRPGGAGHDANPPETPRPAR